MFFTALLCKLTKREGARNKHDTDLHNISINALSCRDKKADKQRHVQWAHTRAGTPPLVHTAFARVAARRDLTSERYGDTAQRLSVSDANRHLVALPETSTCHCWGHLKSEPYCQRWDQRRAARTALSLCLSVCLSSSVSLSHTHIAAEKKNN